MLIDFLRDNLWTGIVDGGSRSGLIFRTAAKIGRMVKSCYDHEDLLLNHHGEIGILPMYSGGVDIDGLSSAICSTLCTFGVPVKLLRPSVVQPRLTEVEEGVFCLNGDRLIDEMSHSEEFERYGRIVVLTDIPVINDRKIWVHGYAGLRVPVAVVSSGRMRCSTDDGIRKVIVHELAHTFGIPHCREEGCIMKPGPLQEVSKKFCDMCAGRLMALAGRNKTLPTSSIACSLSC